VANGSAEVLIRRLLQTKRGGRRDHTIPTRVISCLDTTALLIMPNLATEIQFTWDISSTLEMLGHLTEGLDFMHSNHVVHGDISISNVVCSMGCSHSHPIINVGKFYFIDFEWSYHLAQPPSKRPIQSFPCNGTYDAPEGDVDFDPYSYDVFSLGCLAQYALQGCRSHGHKYPESLAKFAELLTHNTPTRRPTIRQVHRLYPLLRLWFASSTRLQQSAPTNIAHFIDNVMWKLLSCLLPWF